jgi:hypothetical protein
MRPLEVITTQLRQWRESSAEKKAKQLAKASVDIGFTVLNMVLDSLLLARARALSLSLFLSLSLLPPRLPSSLLPLASPQ